MMQRMKHWDWYKIFTIVGGLGLFTPSVYWIKGTYDRVVKIETLKEADHADWLNMKEQLTLNDNTDKNVHADLYRQVGNIQRREANRDSIITTMIDDDNLNYSLIVQLQKAVLQIQQHTTP